MIKYTEGELLNMLFTPDAEDPDWIATSYALRWAMGELVKCSLYIRTYCAIDELPERIVDAMALSLRAQYYDTTLPLDVKRSLVKNTFKWYRTAGTKKAVRELIETVFGSGTVIEWFEDGSDPFTFKVETEVQFQPDTVEQFQEMIRKVKNTRSHLSMLTAIREIETAWAHGIGKTGDSLQILTNDIVVDEAGQAYPIGVWIGMADVSELLEDVALVTAPKEVSSELPVCRLTALTTDTVVPLIETLGVSKLPEGGPLIGGGVFQDSESVLMEG